MTSRERVLAVLECRKPDRPPLNYYGPPETTQKLLAHLKLNSYEELLQYLGADMRYVGPRYVGPSKFSGALGYNDGGTDMWGVTWRSVANPFCTYREVAVHPLAGAKTVREVEEYPWPNPDWMSVDHIAEEIKTLNREEPKAIVLPTGMFFEMAWFLRGFEQYLMDLVENPDIAEAILGHVTRFYQTVTLRAVEAAEGRIDVVWSNSDVGMQTAMLMSPAVWREHVRPWHAELVVPFKRMNLKTRYHTDGAVVPIIEDLIEMGVDMLDPIQPKATGMSAENLARLFGGRISFYGGIDTQELLPFGTPAQIEAEVLHLIEVLGRNGGYMVAASNAVQPDVPIENILTLYRTAREYRYT